MSDCGCFFSFVSVPVSGNGIAVQFDAMPYGTMPYDVSEGEMRWQVYTSLALGAKGVLYFCYWTPFSVKANAFLRGQAIMTPRAVEPGKAPTIDQQVPSQKYPIVQRLNAKLKVLGNFLLKKDSSAVLQLHGAAQETRQIEHPVLTAINGTQVSEKRPLSLFFLTFPYTENDNEFYHDGLGTNTLDDIILIAIVVRKNSKRRMAFSHRSARRGSSSSGSLTATRRCS
jgi:hypothetical protein